MKVQKTIEVWLVKKRLPRPIDLVQYDTGVQLVFAFQDFAIPNGTTATLYVQKPSGKFVYQEKGITTSENNITIALENQALTEHGNAVRYQVRLKNGGDLITTFAGIFRVEESLADSGAVESETVIAAFEEKTAEQIAKIELEAQKAIADVVNISKGLASAIVCETEGELITVADASNDPVPGLHIYGKTTQNGTPTPEAPVELVSVGASGAINTMVGSSNLARPSIKQISVNAGITLTPTEDDNLILNGTTTEGMWKPIYSFKAIEGQTYTISSVPGVKLDVWCSAQSRTVVSKWQNNTSCKLIAEETGTHVICISQDSGTTYNNLQLDCAVNLGSTPLPWEACKEQTLTVSTPNGLPGIPVSSGGNYTDDNGQQWICDEIDFARGVYVQRCIVGDSSKLYLLNSYENCSRYIGDIFSSPVLGEGKTVGLCNYTNASGWTTNDAVHYFYAGAGVNIWLPKTLDIETIKSSIVFIGVLQIPIETALSAEELTAYAALHTNKPNTTVYNDAGAGLKLAYNADTKTYIDNKFAELARAIVNNA